MTRPLVIGSRGSQLALWQARHVAEQLAAAGCESRIEVLKTTGDKIRDVALAQVGATSGVKGVFTKEIEEALLARKIDLAVHSLKDLPTELPAGLAIGATPVRASPLDAICGKRLSDLGPGDRVGTSSLRRAAQLRARCNGVAVLDIRGNVDTRLRKLDDGAYDAILLAVAGLERLGLTHRIAEELPPETMAPAIGQGALAVEVRAGDEEAGAALRSLDHLATRTAIAAERSLLAALHGGCQVPLGGLATVEGPRLRLTATVISQDGAQRLRACEEGSSSAPEELGKRVAERLLASGAGRLISETRPASSA